MNVQRQVPVTRKAVVVGLGLTGQSCIRHLRARGYDVVGVDTRPAPPKLDELRREFPDVSFHTGELRAEWLGADSLLVVSPGVSLKEPAIAQAIANGAPSLARGPRLVPIGEAADAPSLARGPRLVPIGDIELFAREARAPVLAITGANGKSTVTALTGEMCRAGGLKTLVGGNIGIAALDLLNQPVPDVYVLELSSFQLETTWSLDARAAAVLNLTPDHMDRYADMAEYGAAKARIFEGDGIMVMNADDPLVMAMARPARRTRRFTLGVPATPDDYGLVTVDGDAWLVRGTEKLFPASDVRLPGRHNVANTLAAMALAQSLGVPTDACRSAVRAFRGLAHRTEVVAERGGVQWINDSKGTNVGATVAALGGMTRPVILIAGGDGKGQDFGELKAPVSAHARAVVLIGRDAPQIEAALAGCVPVERATDMRAAIEHARKLAQPGDAVLLSPACASFDMFRNYEHRGEVFRATVQEVLQR